MEKPSRITKEKLNIYNDQPVHGWSSPCNGCLAIFRHYQKNKGMTKEEAERMQEMHQLRYI